MPTPSSPCAGAVLHSATTTGEISSYYGPDQPSTSQSLEPTVSVFSVNLRASPPSPDQSTRRSLESAPQAFVSTWSSRVGPSLTLSSSSYRPAETYSPPPSIPSPSPSRTPSSSGRSNNGSQAASNDDASTTHVKRPQNPFILFRNHWVSQNTLAGIKMKGNQSIAASAAWKALSKQEREMWEHQALVEKEKHANMNPGYKYKPRRMMTVTRRRGSSDSSIGPRWQLKTKASADSVRSVGGRYMSNTILPRQKAKRTATGPPTLASVVAADPVVTRPERFAVPSPTYATIPGTFLNPDAYLPTYSQTLPTGASSSSTIHYEEETSFESPLQYQYPIGDAQHTPPATHDTYQQWAGQWQEPPHSTPQSLSVQLPVPDAVPMEYGAVFDMSSAVIPQPGPEATPYQANSHHTPEEVLPGSALSSPLYVNFHLEAGQSYPQAGLDGGSGYTIPSPAASYHQISPTESFHYPTPTSQPVLDIVYTGVVPQYVAATGLPYTEHAGEDWAEASSDQFQEEYPAPTSYNAPSTMMDNFLQTTGFELHLSDPQHGYAFPAIDQGVIAHSQLQAESPTEGYYTSHSHHCTP